ncbi:MAG: tRNA (adenosine(37)-N6)-dimethylallyltransferase MiaA [Pirellulales bacterium]|nr:tRNA (adenosine(37)-N6)-dimethylallyltransferase MiaA [Pirellulales bacterium]
MSELLPALNCWFLTGATAVGKTRVGLALARRLQAEIISLDSMAIYRGMDIGTAKPTPEQQAEVPHHLIDIVDPDEEFSVACYLEAAHAAIAEICSRGRNVLFVGGTPLYLKALLRGLIPGPPANWALRQQIEAEVAEVGNQALYQRLEQIDPVAAAQIHPRDTRRLIRAIEVFRLTGEPISHSQMQFDEANSAEHCRVFVLCRPREQQYERIDRRVDEMLDRGLEEEIRNLISHGKTLGRTARQAVGYQEMLEYFDEGSREAMINKIKTRTRRFSKRQGTWFRSLSECRYWDLAQDASSEDIAVQIALAGANAG